MIVDDIINENLGKYIGIKNLTFTDKGLIATADIVKVYDTLEEVNHSIQEIKSMKEKYTDFEILYGSFV